MRPRRRPMQDASTSREADERWIDHYGFRPLDMPTLVGGPSG